MGQELTYTLGLPKKRNPRNPRNPLVTTKSTA